MYMPGQKPGVIVLCRNRSQSLWSGKYRTGVCRLQLSGQILVNSFNLW